MDPKPPSSTENRRQSERREVRLPVRVRLEGVLEGTSDNLSQAGMLLFSDQPLRVVVEYERTSGDRVVRGGKLIRLQALGDGSTGLAVEFDA